MKSLEDLKELLEEQIKKIAKKGDITPAELDNMYKAVDIVKDIATIKAMDEASTEHYESDMRHRSSYGRSSYDVMPNDGMRHSQDAGASNYYFPPYMYSYDTPMREHVNPTSHDNRRGRDADSDGRYSEDGHYMTDNSYRRGRDARGRYTSREMRYSRAEAKDKMIEKLEKMMDETTSAKDKEVIRTCIQDLSA